MVEVSVVVCARNEEQEIGGCMEKLRAQTLKPEIIVVDGHSSDSTVKIAKKFADKIVFDNKAGLADARNVGAKAASGRIVAYCDTDCRPFPDWTEKISKSISGQTVAVSGPLSAIDGGFKQKFGIRVWADLVPRLSAGLGYHCLWGANMAIERKTLLANPFNVRFLEDFELGSRLRKSKGVLFSSKLRMPMSTRRFAKSFHRTCIKYYIGGALKIKFGKADSGYYK